MTVLKLFYFPKNADMTKLQTQMPPQA